MPKVNQTVFVYNRYGNPDLGWGRVTDVADGIITVKLSNKTVECEYVINPTLGDPRLVVIK